MTHELVMCRITRNVYKLNRWEAMRILVNRTRLIEDKVKNITRRKIERMLGDFALLPFDVLCIIENYGRNRLNIDDRLDVHLIKDNKRIVRQCECESAEGVRYCPIFEWCTRYRKLERLLPDDLPEHKSTLCMKEPMHLGYRSHEYRNLYKSSVSIPKRRYFDDQWLKSIRLRDLDPDTLKRYGISVTPKRRFYDPRK